MVVRGLRGNPLVFVLTGRDFGVEKVSFGRLVSGYVKGRIREGFVLLRKGEFGGSEESGR
jgi:hypothetical protein